jgi:large subunit ribosomal protein L24
MKSIDPGKQRKEMYNAPLHRKRKMVAAHLEENLLLKYDKRSIPVIKGDTVKVMRGSFRGHEDKVVRVNVKKRHLEIEGITMSKADGNKIAKPIHPSNVMVVKLNLTDKWRRGKLERGLSEEAKKEIEKEAEEQIKEAEEELKRIEEEEKELEAEEEVEETEEKTVKKEEKTAEKPKPKKEAEKKPTPKKEPKKETEKKPAAKKKTAEKKTVKKTPVKTTKKEEK